VPQTLSPMQLLWINLISDVLPGLGLALEPPHPSVMRDTAAERDGEIVSREHIGDLGREAAVLAGGPLACCAFGAVRYGANAAPTRTMTFASLVTAQLLHSVSSRSARHSIFGRERLPPNFLLYSFLGLSFAVQAAAFLVPGIRTLLGVGRLGLVDLGVTAAGGIAPFLANEASKLSRERATSLADAR